MSKTDLIKEHLEKHKKITSWEAIKLYRATRLSGIIYNLRKRGVNIHSTEHKGDYAVYTLVEEPV